MPSAAAVTTGIGGCWPRSLPQVAAVVRALELAEALEAERDRVVAATRQERDVYAATSMTASGRHRPG